MAYVPDWERLSDVLKRAKAAGIADDEAQSDISKAIADRKIRVRLTVALEADVFTVHRQMVAKVQGLGSDPKHSALIVECFEGVNVKIPSHLTPGDFDWQSSQPLQPWQVRPRGGRRDEWRSFSRSALVIELRTVEVSAWIQETYGSGGEVARETRQTNVGATTKPPRTKSRPATERAQRIIRELYPDGVPDQAIEPNVNLCRLVGAKLKKAGLSPVSDDSILRAAGRRK